MLSPDTRWPNFTDKDLDFVVENVAPGASRPGRSEETGEGGPGVQGGDGRRREPARPRSERRGGVPAHIALAVLRDTSAEGIPRTGDHRLYGRARGTLLDPCVRHTGGARIHGTARCCRVHGLDDGFIHTDTELHGAGESAEGEQATGAVQRPWT